MTIRKFAVILVLILLLAGCGKSGIPSAPSDIYVLDNAGVLTAETKQTIIAQGQKLDTACDAQIVVLCVRDTNGKDIEQYANNVFNSWGIGDKKENNGLLILLSIDADDYWVTEGTGLEDALSSGEIKLILDEYLEPYFAEKQYDSGVLAVYGAFYNRLATLYGVAA